MITPPQSGHMTPVRINSVVTHWEGDVTFYNQTPDDAIGSVWLIWHEKVPPGGLQSFFAKRCFQELWLRRVALVILPLSSIGFAVASDGKVILSRDGNIVKEPPSIIWMHPSLKNIPPHFRQHLKALGCHVFNDMNNTIRRDIWLDNLSISSVLEKGHVRIPQTHLIQSKGDVTFALQSLSLPFVVKYNAMNAHMGSQGQGVIKIDSRSQFLDLAPLLLERPGFFVAQEYIDMHDVRIYCTDSTYDWSMSRTPGKDQWKCNYALGGTLTYTQREDIDDSLLEASLAIVRVLGLDYVAFDWGIHKRTGIPYLIEINRLGVFTRLNEESQERNLGAVLAQYMAKIIMTRNE